jgi:hypothetical protein
MHDLFGQVDGAHAPDLDRIHPRVVGRRGEQRDVLAEALDGALGVWDADPVGAQRDLVAFRSCDSGADVEVEPAVDGTNSRKKLKAR